MKRIFGRFYSRFFHNIQIRLTCYFLFILLPLVVVSLFANEQSQKILSDQAADRMEVALASAMDYIDLTLQNVEELSTLIATDSTLIKLLDKNGNLLSPQSIVDFSEILKQISNVSSINHIVSQISVYHNQSHMLVSTSYGGRLIKNNTQQKWLSRTAQANGTGILYILADEPINASQTFGAFMNTDSISLVRSIDLYNRDRQSNVLIMTLNKNKLLNLIKSMLPSKNASIDLFNDNNKWVTGTGIRERMKGSSLKSDKDMLSVTVNSKYSKWSLTMDQPKKELYEKTSQLRWYTYVIIGISVLLALGISWVVYSGIASPVRKLSHGMKQLGKGNLNIQLENKWKGEFGYLTRAFNQMALYQKHLIEDHYEQQLRMVNTELKFLQSQINPHFLYNTLDSIYWTAKNYEADEISEMVINLSKFFRLSLNKGKETFTIEENIAHLYYYIRVQQLRFLDNFTVNYNIQEESKPIPIIKLLLQPLVENAILHGIENKQESGKLVISSWLESDMVKLMVQDNGSGMDEERLRYIQSELSILSDRSYRLFSLEEENTKDLFGLRNVMMRIKLYYGKDANLQIDSKYGEGTTIIATLPLHRCKDEVNAYSSIHFD